jgi:hypothetical protein
MDSLYVGIDVAKASFVAAAQGPARKYSVLVMVGWER